MERKVSPDEAKLGFDVIAAMLAKTSSVADRQAKIQIMLAAHSQFPNAGWDQAARWLGGFYEQQGLLTEPPRPAPAPVKAQAQPVTKPVSSALDARPTASNLPPGLVELTPKPAAQTAQAKQSTPTQAPRSWSLGDSEERRL